MGGTRGGQGESLETLEWSSRTLSKGHSLLILTAGIIRRMIVVYTSCGKRVGWEKFSHESFSQQRCDVQQNATNKQPPQVTPMSRRFRVHSRHVHNKFNLGSKLDSESVQSGPRVSVSWRCTVLKLFGPRKGKGGGLIHVSSWRTHSPVISTAKGLRQ